MRKSWLHKIFCLNKPLEISDMIDYENEVLKIVTTTELAFINGYLDEYFVFKDYIRIVLHVYDSEYLREIKLKNDFLYNNKQTHFEKSDFIHTCQAYSHSVEKYLKLKHSFCYGECNSKKYECIYISALEYINKYLISSNGNTCCCTKFHSYVENANKDSSHLIPILSTAHFNDELTSRRKYIFVEPFIENSMDELFTSFYYTNQSLFYDDSVFFIFLQILSLLEIMNNSGLLITNNSYKRINLQKLRLSTNKIWLYISIFDLIPISQFVNKHDELKYFNGDAYSDNRNLINLMDINSFDGHFFMQQFLWMTKHSSNFDYLLLVNSYSGRRFNDPQRHPIYPWITDFTGDTLTANRNLQTSKYFLCRGENQINLNFHSSLEANGFGHHIDDILSDLAYCMYKARVLPKELLLKSVRPNFVAKQYPNSLERFYIHSPEECIPEFYNDTNILKSIHLDMESMQLSECCDNDPQKFIQMHRNLLECAHVSERLSDWIDIVFGCLSVGDNGILTKNITRHESMIMQFQSTTKSMPYPLLEKFTYPSHQCLISKRFQKHHPKKFKNFSIDVNLDESFDFKNIHTQKSDMKNGLKSKLLKTKKRSFKKFNTSTQFIKHFIIDNLIAVENLLLDFGTSPILKDKIFSQHFSSYCSEKNIGFNLIAANRSNFLSLIVFMIDLLSVARNGSSYPFIHHVYYDDYFFEFITSYGLIDLPNFVIEIFKKYYCYNNKSEYFIMSSMLDSKAISFEVNINPYILEIYEECHHLMSNSYGLDHPKFDQIMSFINKFVPIESTGPLVMEQKYQLIIYIAIKSMSNWHKQTRLLERFHVLVELFIIFSMKIHRKFIDDNLIEPIKLLFQTHLSDDNYLLFIISKRFLSTVIHRYGVSFFENTFLDLILKSIFICTNKCPSQVSNEKKFLFNDSFIWIFKNVGPFISKKILNFYSEFVYKNITYNTKWKNIEKYPLVMDNLFEYYELFYGSHSINIFWSILDLFDTSIALDFVINSLKNRLINFSKFGPNDNFFSKMSLSLIMLMNFLLKLIHKSLKTFLDIQLIGTSIMIPIIKRLQSDCISNQIINNFFLISIMAIYYSIVFIYKNLRNQELLLMMDIFHKIKDIISSCTDNAVINLYNEISKNSQFAIDSSITFRFLGYNNPQSYELVGNWCNSINKLSPNIKNDSIEESFNGYKLQSYIGHTNAITDFCIHASEQYFLSGSKDSTIKIWSLKPKGSGNSQLACQSTYHRHKDSITKVIQLFSNNQIVSCDGNVHIWDPITIQSIRSFQFNKTNYSLSLCSLSSHQPIFSSYSIDNTIKIFDARQPDYIEWNLSYIPTLITQAGQCRSMSFANKLESIILGYSNGYCLSVEMRMGLLDFKKFFDHEIVKIKTAVQNNGYSSIICFTVDQKIFQIDNSLNLISSTSGLHKDTIHSMDSINESLIWMSNKSKAPQILTINSQTNLMNVKVDYLSNWNDSVNVTKIACLTANKMILNGKSNGDIYLYA